MSVIINASTSSGLVQTADTSGTLVIQSNGTTQFTVASTGSYGQLKSGTAVASTSGTSIDFTGLPSWIKRITVNLSGVSTNGTSIIQCQIGPSGGVETSSYLGALTASGGGAVANVALSAGVTFYNSNSAASLWHGSIVFTLLNSATNTWAFTSLTGTSNAASNGFVAGSKAIASTLDRIRITTVNGTDTFDAGTINIMYEG